MASSVAIQCLAFGGRQAAPVLEPVRLTLAAERISLRELISRTVAEQIRVLTERHRDAAVVVQLALARQYLTAKEVEMQAAEGRIQLARPHPKGPPPAIDPDREIANAWQGFERRTFRVVVDGVMLNALDDEVVVGQETKVVFLRLTPLVGG